jgi:DNA-binding NarL/FixJ family response regulator
MTPTEAPGATPIRVLLADDHPVVRRGLAALLATLDGIEVVAQAGTGDEAVREVGFSRPDVVVMDLRGGTAAAGPAGDGWEVSARLPLDGLATSDRD